MIELPDFDRMFEYENNFYLTADITRISKILAQYELYKRVLDVPGAVVECGVLKGVSFVRWAMFRDLLSNPFSKKLVGFDIFGKFPEASYEADRKARKKFTDAAGDESISEEQLMDVLRRKHCARWVELVKGDINETVPAYMEERPEFKISLLNLDTEIYEPSKTILETFWPRIERGGILIVDDYGTVAGETDAVDEYFADKDIEIRKLPFSMTPAFIIKP